MGEPQEVDKKQVRTPRGLFHKHNKYNMSRYNNCLEEEEGMEDGKAKMLFIGEALVDLEHVDIEIRNHMTKKPDKT